MNNEINDETITTFAEPLSNTITSLSELCDILNGVPKVRGMYDFEDEKYAKANGLPTDGGIDYSSLPIFGGDEPEDTVGIWSWDVDNLLVSGDDVTQFVIVTRDYWANK